MSTTTRSPPGPGSHIADPAPLGLAAFALTTFVLSFVNTGLFLRSSPSSSGSRSPTAASRSSLAGMWEFAKGNTFGATAFSSYGAFWVSFWWLTGHTDLTGAGARSPTASGSTCSPGASSPPT